MPPVDVPVRRRSLRVSNGPSPLRGVYLVAALGCLGEMWERARPSPLDVRLLDCTPDDAADVVTRLRAIVHDADVGVMCLGPLLPVITFRPRT